MTIDIPRSSQMDWSIVRESIAKHGMRNSNCLAIAPTATISTIVGASQSIEPTYKYLYAKSNLSGDFVQINEYLVKVLKERSLWNERILDDLKYHDGVLTEMQSVPADLKELFSTAFDIDARWLIEAAARRQKWIDQGQSLNLYMAKPSGKAIDAMYRLAWRKGLKTTYYLRCLAATQVEKSTLDVNRHGIQPKWMKSRSESSGIQISRTDSATTAKACSIDNPDCEACQ
jgi:ribonucleoside-diphosphate reductase alpha chain